MDIKNLTKEDIINGIKNNIVELYDLSKEQRGDKDIMLEMVKLRDWVLQFASEELKNDQEIVLKAMKQNAFSLMEAPEIFQEDKFFLTLLEKTQEDVGVKERVWFKEKMEFLANIRRQEERDYMTNNIIVNKNKSKKLKF